PMGGCTLQKSGERYAQERIVVIVLHRLVVDRVHDSALHSEEMVDRDLLGVRQAWKPLRYWIAPGEIALIDQDQDRGGRKHFCDAGDAEAIVSRRSTARLYGGLAGK